MTQKFYSSKISNKDLLLTFVILCQLNLIVNCEELFLDQHIHDLDPFNVQPRYLEQEYDYLKIYKQKNGTLIKNTDKESQYSWSIKLKDYIDLDVETENRFVRVQFLKLKKDKSYNVIGIEALQEAKMQRIFITLNGEIGYCYQSQIYQTSKNQFIYVANHLTKESTFYFGEGDLIQIFYDSEDKSLLLYNYTQDNLFKFPESLLSQAGRKIKVFVGLSNNEDSILLSNRF